MPKGIMRSAVPLPCFFDVVKGNRAVAPTRDRSCRMGRNSVRLYVRTYVRMSVPPLAGPQTLLAGPQTLLAGPQAPQASPQTPSASPQTPPASPRAPPAGPQTLLAGH